MVEPFFGCKDIRSAEEAGEERERGEEGREERQVVEELGEELCKEEVSVRREEYESFEGEPYGEEEGEGERRGCMELKDSLKR